jgi:hypothetical protein
VVPVLLIILYLEGVKALKDTPPQLHRVKHVFLSESPILRVEVTPLVWFILVIGLLFWLLVEAALAEFVELRVFIICLLIRLVTCRLEIPLAIKALIVFLEILVLLSLLLCCLKGASLAMGIFLLVLCARILKATVLALT